MRALDRLQLRDALSLKRIEEFRRCRCIGAGRVRVPDLRGEEFEEATEARSPAAAIRAGRVSHGP